MRLSRRQFIEFGGIGAAAVLMAPGAAWAAPGPAADVLSLDLPAFLSPARAARDYDFAGGIVRTTCWQTATAQLQIEPAGIRLESPRVGCLLLKGRDFDSGYAQEQIRGTLGAAVLDELMHEMSVRNTAFLFT